MIKKVLETMAKIQQHPDYFNEAPVGITLMNSDDVFLDCNNSFQRILGFSKTDLEGKKLTDLIHGDHLQSYDESFALLERNPLSLRLKILNSKGDYNWVWLSLCNVHGATGEFLHRLGYYVDIDEYRTTVLRNIIHDLKNELNKIQLSTVLLKNDLPEKDETLMSYLSIIEEACSRTGNLYKSL